MRSIILASLIGMTVACLYGIIRSGAKTANKNYRIGIIEQKIALPEQEVYIVVIKHMTYNCDAATFINLQEGKTYMYTINQGIGSAYSITSYHEIPPQEQSKDKDIHFHDKVDKVIIE